MPFSDAIRHVFNTEIIWRPQRTQANKAYAADFGKKASLALPPARHAAFLVCMDARLDPAKFAGLVEGDAHVVRNAGV